MQQDIGDLHIAADIGCHALGTFEPFSTGHSILGYGMSLASRAGVSPMMQRRTLAIMGDGGFWHNGLTSGVGNAVFNQTDNVLLVVDTGYSAATGGQDVLSSKAIKRLTCTSSKARLSLRCKTQWWRCWRKK